MPSSKQASRLIQFTSPAGQDVLLANAIDGVEGVSRLYSFHVELLAELGTSIDPKAIVGNKATLQLALLDTQGTRYFNGLVASFEQNPKINNYDSYTVRLVPSLWQLTLATNCRVFQNKTVMEIIKEVIGPYALSVGDVTTFAYKPLDYCTQYNETDFNFISRLAEQFGILYWFEHTANDNKVIFGDSLSAYGACPVISEIAFTSAEQQREVMYRSTVSDFRATATMITGKHTSYNWDFRTFQVGKPGSEASAQDYGHNAFERYSWPTGESGYTKLTDKQVGTPDHGTKFVGAQRDANDVSAEVFHGVSTARSLTAGYTFTLTKHPKSAWNRGYYLTEVAHHATQSPPWGSDGHADGEHYGNSFVAIQSDRIFRPEVRTPRPRMYGPQNAIVVAPDGEDNYIDKFGRVNVRFVWDRTANAHGTDNTWVRVAQPWAGPRTGAYFWPRINDEVLVQFIDGDPDDPIVLGSVYNNHSMPKYALPDMSTRSGFYTRSLKGGGTENANELRFEDKAGSEQIFINAEKDMDIRVENDRRTYVMKNNAEIIDVDKIEKIGGKYHSHVVGETVLAFDGKHDMKVTGPATQQYSAIFQRTIGGDNLEKISGKQGVKITGKVAHEYEDSLSLKIGTNHGEKVGQNYAVDAGMAVYIKAGMTLVLEAGMQISLKVGGNFIDIGPAGVSITGTMVMINSGGAAGAGTPPTIEAPDAPASPASPDDPDTADDGTKGGKM